ncbi:MAG: C2 domain-containing protein [Candidatus Edwardsbacteria bacterium]|nr:C2 domain-containing protein [Candidatus Edwardsbacteria bacterium]
MFRTLAVCALITAVLGSPLLAEKPRIALTPLQVEGEGLAGQREALGNYLEQELLKTKAFAVLAGSDIGELLKQANVQPGAVIDQGLAAQAGKVLKAGKLVWGKLSNDGTKFTFWLKMVDTESGELLFSKTYASETASEAARHEFETNTLMIENELIAALTGKVSEERELKITAVGAAGLVSKDAMSSTDAYVAVIVGDRIIGTTSFKQNRKNPVWYETFTCAYKGEKIQFAFFDRDLTKDEYIGNCELAAPKDGTYDIMAGHGKKVGTFMVEFKLAK